MNKVIHNIDSTQKKIYFVYPNQGNLLAKAAKHFSPRTKAKAKREFKKFKSKSQGAWEVGREELNTTKNI